MKIVGGPRAGQLITLSEQPGGPELQPEGMILEYTFTSPGRATIKMGCHHSVEPKPSVPGLVERYRCHNGAWHYIAPEDTSGFMASPPIIME